MHRPCRVRDSSGVAKLSGGSPGSGGFALGPSWGKLHRLTEAAGHGETLSVLYIRVRDLVPIGISLSDYQDSFVRELQSSSIDFLVLGGMAMRAHGLDRVTRDLDLFVDRSRANAERLLPVIARRFRAPRPS